MTVRRFSTVRFSSLLTFALLLTNTLAGAGPAPNAQPHAAGGTAVIAMLPFDGKEAPSPPRKPVQVMGTANTVAEALQSRPQARYYRVLPADLFGGIARIKYHGKAPDLRAMSRLLKANLLLGGWLEATPGPEAPKPYRMTLTLYDAEGQTVGQLGYDVDAPPLSSQKFLGQATAFFQLLDGALRIPAAGTVPAQAAAAAQPAPPPPQAVPPPPPPSQLPPERLVPPPPRPVRVSSGTQPVSQADDREVAPLIVDIDRDRPLIPHKDASDLYERRPPWQSAFDVRLGYLYNARSLSNEGSALSFPRAGAHGAFLNIELHPLAFFHQIQSPLAGLGLRLSAMLPSWETIRSVNQQGATGSYQASEHRVEFALRWHWNFWNQLVRPDIEVEGLFGDHAFSFSQPVNLPYLQLPPTEYRYLGALLGLRMHFTQWLSARAAFSLAKHLSLGAATTPGVDDAGVSLLNANGYQSYGPGGGWLWRTDLGATAEIWRGILAGLAFYYEQNSLSFNGQGNILRTDGAPVTSARDDYLGVMITVGYYFRPRSYIPASK